MHVRLIVLLLFIGIGSAFGQAAYVPLGHFSYHNIDRFDIKYGKVIEPYVHTGVKPYSRKEVAQMTESIIENNIKGNGRLQYNVRNLLWDNEEWTEDTLIASQKAVWNTFYRKPASLYSVDVKDFILKINPVFQFGLGKTLNDPDTRLPFHNTRGVELRGSIKKRLSFYTYLTDNQYRAPFYVRQQIELNSAVPGQLFYKDFRTTGVDFFEARGYINFNVLDHIDIQFGHDRNFWGNGFRSLMLSDFGGNYLFLKMQTTIWRITYTNLFTELTSTYRRGLDRLLDKKYGAFHHLNIHIGNSVDIGLFEGVMFERERGFELAYLNPIIFYRAVEQALGSPDNALVGADFKVNFLRHVQLYGQLVFDEFNFSNIRARNGWWANKFALQAGGKYIDAFGLPNFDLQAEFNWVRPFTYTHNTTATTYTHYNQPLAHPLGANFWELIGVVRYQLLPELTAQLTTIYFNKGLDTTGTNFGGDIFRANVDSSGALLVENEFGNEMLQGAKQKTLLTELVISYQARHNLFIDFTVLFRNSFINSTYLMSESFANTYIGVGLRYNVPWRGHYY